MIAIKKAAMPHPDQNKSTARMARFPNALPGALVVLRDDRPPIKRIFHAARNRDYLWNSAGAVAGYHCRGKRP
jgi:hypothetical protein